MLAASLRAYPLVAVLVCGGLFSVLILRRVFKLDKALDDPARIAAIRPLIVPEAEQETSWDDRVKGAAGHLVSEVVFWSCFGLLYLAFGESAYLLMVLIGLGLFSVLILWRVFKPGVKALIGRIEIEAGAATALGFLIIAAICLTSFSLTQTQSAPPVPTLSLSYRNDVIQIQQRLIELGFLPEGFFPEGNWGPISQQALLEFKKQSELGSNTWNFTTRSALFSGQATHALSRQR
jgi:hypothetical protein